MAQRPRLCRSPIPSLWQPRPTQRDREADRQTGVRKRGRGRGRAAGIEGRRAEMQSCIETERRGGEGGDGEKRRRDETETRTCTRPHRAAARLTSIQSRARHLKGPCLSPSSTICHLPSRRSSCRHRRHRHRRATTTADATANAAAVAPPLLPPPQLLLLHGVDGDDLDLYLRKGRNLDL